MFLKSIEIRGFKSFADKTELNFKQGITAVVGPNGSGKSNISDAVKWVLGEQSVRNLRGDKMEDVIFAGTQFRKPVGLAQVALTLDNSDSELDIDYTSVTVARRLYRSGESEYLINNTICRLKDIQNLFMDTGIGKEGYSIIGQGKIDAILSGKPEERRKLLEEAAGIVKYKTRKEEAEKKLSSTNDNLVRVRDILETYEERIEPLRIDSEKAKTFLEYSEELKVKEINIIIDFIARTKSQVEELNKKSEKAQNVINDYENQKLKLKEDLLKWNKELEDFDASVAEKKQNFFDEKSKNQEILSKIKIGEERIQAIDSNIDRLKKEAEECNIAKVKAEERINILLEQIASTEEEKVAVDEKIQEKESSIELVSTSISKERGRLKEVEDTLNSLQSDQNAYTNKIVIIENNIESINSAAENLAIDLEGTENSIQINKSTRNYLVNQTKDIDISIAKYENNYNENKKRIASLKHRATVEEKKIRELNSLINKDEANLNALVNLENQYEGYNKSVKKLMQQYEEGRINNINGQCYVIGDIIKVKKEHETAIEIAMGAAISNIITEDEYSAKNLIAYLKKNNLGRATFFPLNIVKGNRISASDAIKRCKGYIGIASELIEYNEKFKGIMDYVLGKTFICETMDDALNIAKIVNYKNKIVTLEGEVINPGGALTGGSIYSKSFNIIGRKREIEELKDKIHKNNIELDKLTEAMNNVNMDIKSLDEKNLNIRDEIHFQSIEKAKVSSKISSMEEECNKLEVELEKYKNDINTHKLNLNKLKLDKEKLVENIEVVGKKIEELKEEYNSIHKLIDGSMGEIQHSKEELTNLKVRKAQIEEVINSRKVNAQRISEEINNFTNKSNSIEKETSDNSLAKKDIINTIEKDKNDIEDILLGIEKLEKEIQDSDSQRITIKQNIDILTSKSEDLSLEFEKIEKEYHRNQVALVKIETEEKALLEKLNEEYNITYAEALKFKVDFHNISDLKAQVALLKEKIHNLGTVNLGAIEEYKEVNEKYTFMVTQIEDLESAKEELITVIDDMTSKMKEVFKENFETLRINFNDTFKALFKGGRADLILSEGDELTSKIEINVEPPGKKLQNINLMSGGEKVLSAIALLFAILKMKPTPFCILDEIEAALDDANVIRYAEFLKKFSSNIQFIIITHRKGTMEASDMMYGVTMEEKGVSKVVSVDLTK